MSWKSTFIITGIVLLAVSLAGCLPDVDQSQPKPDMANPASVYCQGLGFKEETRQNEAGQYGVCVFPDGTTCESWDFLAGRCGQERSYCAKQGYTLQANEDANIGTCVFDDSSTCAEYSYFQGECKPGENLP